MTAAPRQSLELCKGSFTGSIDKDCDITHELSTTDPNVVAGKKLDERVRDYLRDTLMIHKVVSLLSNIVSYELVLVKHTY